MCGYESTAYYKIFVTVHPLVWKKQIRSGILFQVSQHFICYTQSLLPASPGTSSTASAWIVLIKRRWIIYDCYCTILHDIVVHKSDIVNDRKIVIDTSVEIDYFNRMQHIYTGYAFQKHKKVSAFWIVWRRHSLKITVIRRYSWLHV